MLSSRQSVLASCVIVLFLLACAPAYADSLGPGTYVRFVEAAGLLRRFIIHVPPSYNGQKTPLVFSFHGSGQDAAKQELISRLDDNSDLNGYIVVYPDAVDGHWDDGRKISGTTNYPDIPFVKVMLDYIPTIVSVDKRRVYTCGYSNGSLFTERLALQLPEHFAAAAGIACALTFVLDSWYNNVPTQPVPIAIFHGTADPFVPFKGGFITDFVSGQDAGQVLSAFSTADWWAHRLGFIYPQMAVPIQQVPSNGCTATKWIYRGHFGNCVFYQIFGGGHTWPGGRIVDPSKLGPTDEALNADEELWSFFKQYTLPHTLH